MDEEIALRHLDQVERHIADARAPLSRQRALIGPLGQLNAVADPERARAETALFSIEDNISAFEEQRRRIGAGFPCPTTSRIFRSMERAQLQEHLAQTDRHMAELKARIGRRRLILARTLAECRRLLVAKSTLQAFEGSLHKFGEHCELILDQLKRPPSE